MGNGANFEVPQEVLAVLPSDPYDQLELARKITAMAVAEKLSKLEGETGKLRAKLAEKDLVIADLQDRVMDAETTLQETTSRLSAALDDHSKLTNEKNHLVNMVKKLNRDVAKLETFKRTLMQSLQDDGDDHKGGGGGDSYGHAPSFSSSVLMANSAAASVSEGKKFNNNAKESRLNNSRGNLVEQEDASETSPLAQESNEVKHVEMDTPKPEPQPHQQQQHQQVNHALRPSPPSQASSYTPVESTRSWQSSVGSPERTPAAERPPPPESKLAIPFSLPSSRATTAPNSPPNANSTPGRTPKVDGKEFFRQARNRLSYEQFSSFLANIKELNAHRQSREETLRKADKTFGPENKDLYIAFDGLLSRHLAS